MRRWALGIVGLLVTACGSILGVEPLTTTAPSAASGDDDDSAAPVPVFDAAPQLVDASDFVDAAPGSQCFATAATPPRSITAGGGGNTWIQLDDMMVEDGKNAVGAGCCSGDTTMAISAVNFGFDVPLNAQIQGITLRIKALSDPGGLFSDNSVVMTSNGDIGTELKRAGGWSGTYESRVYGNDVSLDGLPLTPDDVNSPTFGVRFSATKPPYSNPAATFEVDVVQVTVFYCQ